MSQRAAIRWLPTVLFAVVVAFGAGHAASTPDVPGGGPFVFAAPATFTRVDAGSGTNPNVAKLWVEPTAISPLDPRATLSHSPHRAALEEPALAEIAAGMPAIYANSKGTWKEARHVVHIRPDGGKVALIVGDLTTDTNVRMTTMQMMFPDDTGSSIVTASFAVPSATRLIPAFEKAMDDSTGVKKPGKPAPN
ncbi:MAG: hypothetical protein ABI551_17385, partial [Polyangiaceae bacterium]